MKSLSKNRKKRTARVKLMKKLMILKNLITMLIALNKTLRERIHLKRFLLTLIERLRESQSRRRKLTHHQNRATPY